jgi:hypothetical protein
MAPKFPNVVRNDEDQPVGYRSGPSRAALFLGFNAAKEVIHDITVREMSARQFADLVVALGYAFEEVTVEETLR